MQHIKQTLITLLVAAVAVVLLTAVACNMTTDADSKADHEGVHPIGVITPEELATWAKIPPAEFAGSILGWGIDDVTYFIEGNGIEGTPESELSTLWRVVWEDGPTEVTLKEAALDVADGRHNLIIENGIVIGIIVEQIDGPDIEVMITGMTNPMYESDELGSDGKPLDLDCATPAFNGPIEMCSSENWER